MIVADASAAVLALTSAGSTRTMLGDGAVAAPYLIESELANAMRGLVHRDALAADEAGELLLVWAQLGVERFGAVGLLPRMWELRSNVSAYDATYVALAEQLGCELVTADAKLAGAPGPRCPITVLKN